MSYRHKSLTWYTFTAYIDLIRTNATNQPTNQPTILRTKVLHLRWTYGPHAQRRHWKAVFAYSACSNIHPWCISMEATIFKVTEKQKKYVMHDETSWDLIICSWRLAVRFVFVISNAPGFMVLKGSVSQTVFSEKIKAICSVRLPWQNPMAVVLVGWISTAMNSQIQDTISFTSTESYLQPGTLIWPLTQLPTCLGKAIDLKLDDVFSSYASDLHRHCVKDTGRDLLLCKVSMLTI